MTSLIAIGLIVLFTFFIYKFEFESYYDEIPAFVNEYRQSWIYWASAFLGGILGTIFPKNWRPHSTVIVALIFLSPILSYYYLYQPFGITCEYRPISAGRVDIAREESKVVEKQGGVYEIPIIISAGRNIEKYELEFRPPNGTEIGFVDYQKDDQNFDPFSNTFMDENPAGDSTLVGIYIVTSSGISPGTAAQFEVIEESTGECIEEIQLLPN